MEENGLTLPEQLTLLALAWYAARQSLSPYREEARAYEMEQFIREHWKGIVK